MSVKQPPHALTETELESIRKGHFEPPTFPKDPPKCKKCGNRMVYPSLDEYFDFFEGE